MAKKPDPKSKPDDELEDAKEAFQRAFEAEIDNRREAEEDLKFARLGEQWEQHIKERRDREHRPCLTINRMPAFIRQVVNDCRQNKPQIKVKPVDDKSDPATAQVINGLIKNIEYSSNADVAYDTAADFAVTMGFGYVRVNIDYACDDTFDKDITIQRVSNPFSIYGDPHSTAADSSDWNEAFVVDKMTRDAFKAKYKGAEEVDWDALSEELKEPWSEGDKIQIAEYWKREEVADTLLLVKLADGSSLVVKRSVYEAQKDTFDAGGATVESERPTRSYKVNQRIMTGAEILETNEWAGKYIPIIPVYGEEVNVNGKRYFRSLIRDAKDPQRMYNYWRTTTAELIALAPKTPFIGPVGAFETDLKKWQTANTDSHAFIEHDGAVMPTRQPFVGVPAGPMQEALTASDDMKAVMGLYDASLGQRSNETSGVAITNRQREGDVSTFHFIDNLSRGIKHTGRVVLDLIPLVFNKQRIIRTIGAEGEVATVPLMQPVVPHPEVKGAYLPAPQPPMPAPPQGMPQGAPMPPPQGAPMQPDPTMQAIPKVFDLTAGKYDLAVESGPSFTTQREEMVEAVTGIIRAFPPAAGVLGGLLIKHMDFPNADEIAARLDALTQPKGAPPPPPPTPADMIKAQEVQQRAAAEQADQQIDAQRVQIEGFNAQTDRLRAIHDLRQPVVVPQGRT